MLEQFLIIKFPAAELVPLIQFFNEILTEFKAVAAVLS